MIKINYEIYRNDYDRQYADKIFSSMSEFKDWMFGSMNQPYVDSFGDQNMYFLDHTIRLNRSISSGDEIRFKPARRGPDYWIHCVSDNNRIVFSNGKYTNGQCYISDGFKAFMKECQDRRDGKEQTFVFGEIDGYTPAVASGVNIPANGDMPVAKKLIDAMSEYGFESNWTDSDIIDALISVGITEEDFKNAGYAEFVKDYFESEKENKPSIDSQIQSASSRTTAQKAADGDHSKVKEPEH